MSARSNAPSPWSVSSTPVRTNPASTTPAITSPTTARWSAPRISCTGSSRRRTPRVCIKCCWTWQASRSAFNDSRVADVPQSEFHAAVDRATVPPIPQRNGHQKRGGGGGVWDRKVCAPKMARPDFPFCKFYFFPQWPLWLGGGGASPAVVSHSNASLPWGTMREDPNLTRTSTTL